MVFPTFVIRKLARSEEMFAQIKNFVGLTAHMSGQVDIDAMSLAFDTLLQAHPVLAGHLERGPDARHQIVVDDLLHPGIWVDEGDSRSYGTATMQLDQSVSLVNLRLTLTNGQAELTLYIHHSLADAHHQFGLLEELFSWYTDAMGTGSIAPVNAQPAPEPLEVVLEERGIRKQRRSGLERFMPAMFAYDLPPSKRATTDGNPAVPALVPAARSWLTKRDTQDLVAFCRTNRLSLSAVVSAAILLAEWQLRDTPHIPIPYVYPVDLRYLLAPPVSATGSTNPLGLATYLAEIEPNTDIVALARDIADTFRADLSAGVIQQSFLHFSPQYVGNPPGLPDVVLSTDGGPAPTLRTPPNLELVGCETELFFATSAGVDMYCSATIAERLLIEHHSHAPPQDKSIEVIQSLLCSIASEYGWMTE
jgi:phenolphthiocerol/phthiocerol/phthiodiolone dimycocerosyl transferase